MNEALRRLWTQLQWANRRVAQRLGERDGEADGAAALRLFRHLVYSERVWLDRIRVGVSEHPIWPEGEDEETDVGPAELLEMSRTHMKEVLELVDAEGDLHREVEYRNSSGTEYRTELADIVLHVALHGTYHRGQIAASLRANSLEPVNTDYMTWARAGRPGL